MMATHQQYIFVFKRSPAYQYTKLSRGHLGDSCICELTQTTNKQQRQRTNRAVSVRAKIRSGIFSLSHWLV